MQSDHRESYSKQTDIPQKFADFHDHSHQLAELRSARDFQHLIGADPVMEGYQLLTEQDRDQWMSGITGLAERDGLPTLDLTELEEHQREPLHDPESDSELADVFHALDTINRVLLFHSDREKGLGMLDYLEPLIERRMIAAPVLCNFSSLGIYIAETGEPERAVEHFERALELFDIHPDREWASKARINSVLNRANALWLADRRDEAELELNTLLAEMARESIEMRAMVLNELAFLKLLGGNLHAAENYLQPAEDRGEEMDLFTRFNQKVMQAILALLRGRALETREIVGKLLDEIDAGYLAEDLHKLDFLARWELNEISDEEVRERELKFDGLDRLRPLQNWIDERLGAPA